MKLAEFVRSAPGEVAFGVHAAKADARDLVAIVPGSLNGDQLLEKTYIDFDVAVTATDESGSHSRSGSKMGGGINVVGIKLGIDANSEGDMSTKSAMAQTSRISFKVPVYLNANFRNDSSSSEEASFVYDLWDKKFTT